RPPPAPRNARRLGERRLEVDEDCSFGARRHERLRQALDVHVGPAAVAPLLLLERYDGEDPVGAHELAVPERNHPRSHGRMMTTLAAVKAGLAVARAANREDRWHQRRERREKAARDLLAAARRTCLAAAPFLDREPV